VILMLFTTPFVVPMTHVERGFLVFFFILRPGLRTMPRLA
jgi:hypothetical protein